MKKFLRRLKPITKTIFVNNSHRSQRICFLVLLCLMLSNLLTGKILDNFGDFKTPALRLSKKEKEPLRYRSIDLPPGDFNTSISASSLSVNAGTAITYIINYSTGATASNIEGAKVSVFLPVPVLNGGLISFNGTTDVASSNLSSTAGGYNYDIYFVSPLSAGKQGMMELTVIYPEGTICDGTSITAVATASTNAGASDNNTSDDSAAVTVSVLLRPGRLMSYKTTCALWGNSQIIG